MNRPVRVYLDTALLIDRADRNLPRELVERFDDAATRSGAETIVSMSHLWDIQSSANPEARGRTIATLEGLPNLRMVTEYPPNLEKPRIDAVMSGQVIDEVVPDITLGVVSDLQAEIDALGPGFAAMRAAGHGMAEGGNTSRKAPPTNGSDEAMAEAIRLFVGGAKLSDLIRTPNGELVESVTALLAALGPLEDQMRSKLREDLGRVGGDPRRLVRAMRRTKGSPADFSWSSTKGGEERWYEVARQHGPGLYVSKMLSKRRASDERRTIKPSDLADADHALYLPYMDLVTVDNENHDPVHRALRDLVPTRPVKLYRNGEFRLLVETLEAASS